MSTQPLKKDNVSFWLHSENDALIIKEGIVNIYHSEIAPDGQAQGPRAFLFQQREGELIFPVQPFTNTDGASVGILAVPMRDSALEMAGDVFSPDLCPLAAAWLTKCGRRLGYARERIDDLCAGLDAQRLDAFNLAFAQLADERVRMETERVFAANRRRYAGEDAYLQGALNTLQTVIPGSKAEGSDATADGIEDPLIKACAAVAGAKGMKITVSEALREGGISGDIVDNIADASHFRTREVILSGKWYRQDNGPLLAKMEETGEPVALLQKSPQQYILYNPASEERVKVTKDVAEKISSKATMFYRSLPMNRLKSRDVFKFAMQGTGRADWICVFVMGLCGGLLGMLSPEITGKVFDTVIPEGNRGFLVQIGFLMGAVALSTFAFELTRAFAMQRISGNVERDLQSAVWDRLLSLPVGFFKQFTAGELTERAMSISRIREILSTSVVNTIITSIFSVFYIITMFRKSVKLAWIGLAILSVTLLISILFGYLQIKYEGDLLKTNNKISGRMFGWLSGLAKIKMSGSEKRTFYNWAQMFRRSRGISFRKESMGNWSAVFQSVVTLISSMIIYAAMFKLKDAQIAAGAFIAFNAALQKPMASCIGIARTVMDINVIIPLYKEVKPIFEAVPEYDEQKNEAGQLAGDIELSHINFSYTVDGPQVIKDVSMHIRSGEHVALVGPSGSGKSTLFRILLAFEKPDSGEIFFDGISLSQVDVRSVRRQLGVVLQSGQLLAGSIFKNVAGSNPNITQEDAMRAIRQAGMEDDLAQMPMGLHTMVSDGVGTLSGGQRQRLLIARALAGNPKILFFDEATSALDNKTQKIVSESINRLRATRITIAHRLSTIQDCDRIIVLESGRITEQGSYDELMRLNGTFAEMARRQII